MKNRAVLRGCVCVFLALAAGPLPAGAEAKLDADAVGGHLTTTFSGEAGLSRNDALAELRRYFVL